MLTAACPDCEHVHTPDGCTGPPSASDQWAGVSPSACDCDTPQADQCGGGAHVSAGAGTCVCGEREVDLFGDVVEPVDPTRDGLGSGRSDGVRRTERQAALVKLGQHPLMTGPIHPEADRSAMKSDGSSLPFRCGSCIHRVIRSGGGKKFPKCDLTPMSHSEASDVRAWWPACPSYTPTPKE